MLMFLCYFLDKNIIFLDCVIKESGVKMRKT